MFDSKTYQIIDVPESSIKARTIIVDINQLVPDNSRKNDYPDKELNELVESIKTHGILQPILVYDRHTYYEIAAGERRWKAAKMAGLNKIPIIIFDEKEIELKREETKKLYLDELIKED